MTSSLRPYQREGLDYALKARRCFVTLPMRTGKSPVALAAVRQTAAYPVVIVCPAYTKAMWGALLEEWLPEAQVSIVGSSYLIGGPNIGVYVVSYDAIVAKDPKGTDKEDRKTLSPLGEQLAALKPRAVILDESQKIKDKKAKRSKACKSIAKHAFLRLCLTGTPIDAKPEEFVSQLVFLDRMKELGGEWMFKKRYCVSEHHTGTWDCKNAVCLEEKRFEKGKPPCQPCPGWAQCYCGQSKWGYWNFSGAANLVELNNRLRGLCYFRKRQEECEVDLPPFRRELVPMVAEESKLAEYRKAEDDFLKWMEKNRGRAAAERAYRAETITRMNVLKQLAAIAKMDSAREWVEEYLEDAKRLVIFTTHTEILKRVPGWRLNIPPRSPDGQSMHLIYGETPLPKRVEMIEDFSKRPYGILVANIHAAGLGLDLSAAKACVFLELDWSPSVHDQAEARLISHLRKEPVVASYLILKETIEEEILAALDRKRSVIAGAVDGVEYRHDETDADVEMEVAQGLLKSHSGGTHHA